MGKIDPLTKAVVPPIHVATTYIRDADNAYSSGFVYGRPDNETVHEAQAPMLAMLEEAKAGALLFGSGMAAATAVFQALSPGDHVVASKVMYWALRAWLPDRGDALGAEDRVRRDRRSRRAEGRGEAGGPQARLGGDAVEPALDHHRHRRCRRDRPRRRRQARGRSTCASPVHTRPLTLGADIVMHAATRVLNGHSDVVAGALCASEDDEFWARIKTVRKMQGGILGPFEAYLLMRGMRTLHVRQERQSASAMALAQKLSAHPLVSRVLYPGLPQHPGHDIAARQMQGGFGYMLSIQVSGGERAAVKAAAHVELYKRATSLGGVEPDRASRLDRGRRLTLPARPAAAFDRH